MGTNYYFHYDICPHCNRTDPPRHIGKSSAGWCFALHIYPGNGINDLEDWVRHITEEMKFGSGNPGETPCIQDEYGDTISLADLLFSITERKGLNLVPNYSKLDINASILGPNNLLRCAFDDTYPGHHGSGTWDCCNYEFD